MQTGAKVEVEHRYVDGAGAPVDPKKLEEGTPFRVTMTNTQFLGLTDSGTQRWLNTYFVA